MKYAFCGGKLLDGTREMQPREGLVLRTDGDRITDIVPEGTDLTGYEVVDLKGGYLMPGLINMHVHLAGSGKPGLHLLDLLPQLAPLAHGLEPEKGPGLSERRARRAALRRRLARVWLGQETAEPAAGRLDLIPGLLEELERRHILLEDEIGRASCRERV